MTEKTDKKDNKAGASKKAPEKKAGFFGWMARFIGWSMFLAAAGALCAALFAAFVFSFVYARLPAIDTVQHYQPHVPLRVWTADGSLIAEFGSERRNFVPIAKMPKTVRNAILAAEDSDFYEHGGIKFTGILRAAIVNVLSGKRSQGGSTITQQVARNFYFSSERSYIRKIYEIVMAYKIEQTLTKDQIFEIYANQIYLGNRSYGFSSAARTYFGKELEELTVAEAAMLAGLPVAPAAYNPYANPRRALSRRSYVLSRMHTLGFIDEDTYRKADASKIVTVRSSGLSRKAERSNTQLHAEYVAEMARILAYETYGEEAYQLGLNIYTTIRDADQKAAWAAMRRGVLNYDAAQGWRGPEKQVDPGDAKAVAAALSEAPACEGLLPAVVTAVRANAIDAVMAGGRAVTIEAAGLKMVRSALQQASRKPAKGRAYSGPKLVPGALVRLCQNDSEQYHVCQIPKVEVAAVSADFNNGAVRALIGGFDFGLNKFNHVTQAWRQPGSSFKPFIASAALEKGFAPSTMVTDAPILIDPKYSGGQLWEPNNADKKYLGPMRLSVALAKSRNLPFVRVMLEINPEYAHEYVTRFGFDGDRHPAQLSTALGAGSVTPWQSLGGYMVLANGGFRVRPYIIEKITDAKGKLLVQAPHEKAGDENLRAISARNAYVMNSLLNTVATSGTGARFGAAFRGRHDVGAKTGTSNDAHDAWFCSYGGTTAAVGWMGYDQIASLGRHASGGGLVLPIITDYMRVPLAKQPDNIRQQPPGLVRVDGELFYAERPIPPAMDPGAKEQVSEPKAGIRDQLF